MQSIYSQSLESKYRSIAAEDSLWSEQLFGDYREPNEGNPQAIEPHLKKAWDREGIAVSTGAERSFFHLLFSDHCRCQGIVIRDINPPIIAYVHFNILLLRIAIDVEDYANISSSKRDLAGIKERVLSSEIPEKFREFYLRHFDALAVSYYQNLFQWKDENKRYFQAVQYQENPTQFQILQSYARSGNIIATLGDISDLSSFYLDEVVVVDVSNIDCYTILDIQCNNVKEAPTILWTRQHIENATYSSRKHCPLSRLEREEMNQLLLRIGSAYRRGVKNLELKKRLENECGKVEAVLLDYSRPTFAILQAMVDRWFIEFPDGRWVDSFKPSEEEGAILFGLPKPVEGGSKFKLQTHGSAFFSLTG